MIRLAVALLLLWAGVADAQSLSKTDGSAANLAGTPVVSACGSTPNGSVSGTDERGIITIGGGAVVSCTLSWSATRAATPVCVASSALTVALPLTLSTTSMVIAATLTGGTVAYVCFGL